MPRTWVTEAVNDFSLGEISPRLFGRFDAQLWKMGVAMAYNVVPTPGGGLRRRPGTRHIQNATGGQGRLFPLKAADGTRFTILVDAGNGGEILVFSVATHALVQTITGVGYVAGDLASIRKAQGPQGLFLLFCSSPSNNRAPIQLSNAATNGSGLWSVSTPTWSTTYTNFMVAGYYAGGGAFADGRLWVWRVPGQLNAIFASSIPTTYAGTIADYTTFTPGTAPTNSIYEIQSDISTPINWLFGGAKTILVGTDEGIWFDPSAPPPVPATFCLKGNSVYGVGVSTPEQVTNVTLYASTDQRAFRALILNLYRGYYPDSNLAENCDHLMSRHILDFCVTRHPETVAWLMMADGSFLSATVKQEDTGFTVNSQAAFAQQSLGGSGHVVAMCSVRNTYWDEVWLQVQRVVNGSPVYSIEYFYLDDVNLATVTADVYLDNAMTIQEGTPQTTVVGLADLNGLQVATLADGYLAAPSASASGMDPSGHFQTVTGGEVFLQKAATYITTGCPYYYAVRTLPPNTPARGTGQAKTKRLEKAWVRAYNTVLFYIGATLPSNPLESQSDAQKALPAQIYGVMTYGSAQFFWSGDIALPLAEGVDELAELYVYGWEPFGFNLNAIMGRIAVMEI